MTVTPSVAVRPLRVALLGLGTVGGAVASRLLDAQWRRHVEARGANPPQLVVVGVREPMRRRAVELSAPVERTDDLASIVERDDVDVVIELLGGLEPAGSLVRRALERGVGVVTANKALLAEAGPALERVARSSMAPLRFEAAAAGGIPILSPLSRDLGANRVRSVRGILNGTTNFILSEMATHGTDYATALADAQSRGYAEADPTMDVEGRDAAHKLVLLARLAFGVWVQPSAVRRSPPSVDGDGPPGITGVDSSAISAAASEGFVVKLVASVERAAGVAGSRLVGAVSPCAVRQASFLGTTGGVTNAVEVSAHPVGRASFRGPGAGGDPTSSAVLGDVLAIGRGEGSTWADLAEALPAGELGDVSAAPSCWLWAAADGSPGLTDRLPLDEARGVAARAGASPTTVLYRVLDEDDG